jgi:hypothetical protein
MVRDFSKERLDTASEKRYKGNEKYEKRFLKCSIRVEI